MVDITHKKNTLRKATAQAIVKVSDRKTIEAIENNKVPKGNVLEAARIAGLFAAKRTSDNIPDCHPIPIEFTEIRSTLQENSILIESEIHTIYKTGVEVEAMYTVSIAALTMYDMLKPIDKGVYIEQIKLIEKTGGKSERKNFPLGLTAAIVVCSDSISQGLKEDSAGKVIIEKLEGFQILIKDYCIIADERDDILSKVHHYVEQKISMVIFTGGTGLSSRDITPETLIPLLERRISGVEETIRAYGQNRTPYAMLSRSVVGTIQETLIIALPGSTKGASESVDAIFPEVMHIFRVMAGKRHD